MSDDHAVRQSHWWCPDCGVFDGPITDECCDACDPLDGHSQGVQHLVPASDLVDAMVRLAGAGSRVNGLRWAMHDADALLTPGMKAGVAEAKERILTALASDENCNDEETTS